MKKLNIGSGAFKKEGYVNMDYSDIFNPDVIHDLNKFPYPLEDDEFDLVEADHVLEHLLDPFGTMKELARVVKPGGLIKIKVPHFSRGFTHPGHKRGFDVSFPYYFQSHFKGYHGFELTLKKMKLSWFAQPYFKKTVLSKPAYYFGYTLGGILSFFANIAPFFFSRIWCFWFGGFEEIEFHFEVPQKA